MNSFKCKAKNLKGEWIEGNFVEQYFSSKKQRKIDAIFFTKQNKTYREEIYTNTLTYFLPTPSLNIQGLYVDSDIFEFDFIPKTAKNSSEYIKLKGILTWNDNDLSYEIDVYSSKYPEYVCITFKNPDEYICNLQIIGNKTDNPELLK